MTDSTSPGAGRAAADLPAANQRRTEPFPPAPSQAPHADAPAPLPAAPPTAASPTAASPTAAAGRVPAVALPGKPDGEVDTRT